MKIYQVTDPEFAGYGRIIEGLDTEPFVKALDAHTPLPDAVGYVPEEAALQNLPQAQEMALSLYGGMPVQFGWCNGHNTKLNCFEYHRCSEFNLGSEEFILLLGKESDMHDFKLDTSSVKAFRVPKGVLVEVFATTLHYAPCQASADHGFRVMIVLPKMTNVGTAELSGKCPEDRLLFATNKWLIAHPSAAEASQGAWVGLVGDNPDIAGLI
ncbi:MAG: DUF4867 family protein [Butyrivibrio sp.]|jgi:hypothetical protein|nr:DUF4867 family protein [Butyrivibrio sp.]